MVYTKDSKELMYLRLCTYIYILGIILFPFVHLNGSFLTMYLSNFCAYPGIVDV